MIAVSFDADQTLWDFRGVMVRALQRTVEEIERRCPELGAGAITADELQRVRDEIVQDHRGRPHRLEDVRELAFRAVLGHHGLDDAELAAEVTEHYLALRFSEIRMYDDVVPTLDAIRRRHRIGLLSNGNTYPDRCGLPGVFDATVLGPDHGFEKPDRRAFEAMAGLLGAELGCLVHVGDDADDVLGANEAGATSVWINRSAGPSPLPADAHHEIRSLAKLEAVLVRVEVSGAFRRPSIARG